MSMSEKISSEQDWQIGEGESVSGRMVESVRVLVAASGTGGHLIPAVHIIDAIKSIQPQAAVECIGVGRPLEEKILGRAGLTRHIITSFGIKRRGVFGILRFLLSLPKCFFQCVRLYKRFRPDVVVGVGGYASVVPIVVAKILGIPTWAHEAELRPGLANSVLGFFASTISISFQETKIRGFSRLEYTGHPVRPELGAVQQDLVRTDAPRRLLVLGGSQGAQGLDQVISEIGPVLKERDAEVVHQCRPDNIDLVVNSYRACGVRASVVSFIDDMAGAYDWADVIISRAGASSVAEIGCVNKPTIFVPYPFQQGTHQTENARVLALAGKAFVVEETQPNFGSRLRDSLVEIFERDTYIRMKKVPFEPRGLGAAKTIALGVLRMVKRDLP